MDFHRKWVSPVTAVTFVALTISGLLMLFHIRIPGMRNLHEWTGVVFAFAGIFHLALNWRMLVNHLSTKTGIIAAVSVCVLCVALLAMGDKKGKRHGQDNHGPQGYGERAPAH
ncbi:MAG: hypothetical protein CXZ00_10850 [Acidobacteria bacterium]|nr:MAG: hypothetical protein CXZ00_10850 [Acidobacteriota bacterium]